MYDQKTLPITKISEILQELTGLSYSTVLDLKMGCYTVRLNPNPQHLNTIVATPWGHVRQPMDVMVTPEIFQK